MAYKHHDHEGQEDYKVVSLVDVNELLSFAKNEYKSLEEEIEEEQRVEKELKRFIESVEKHSKHKINFIGHEKRYGNHLVRFLFKEGGFLEVILDKPLALNAHFTDKQAAKRFAEGLKKALKDSLPDSPVKGLVVDSIKVEDGFSNEILTLGKWTKIHRLAIHKTAVISVVALLIFIISEITKAVFTETALKYLHIESVVIPILTAVLIAIFFEPIKDSIESFVEKNF